MDQGTPHKTRDSETYRGESGRKPQRYGHKGKFVEYNSNALCCKNENLQMRSHYKAFVRQKTQSIRQKGHQQTVKGSLAILNQIGDQYLIYINNSRS